MTIKNYVEIECTSIIILLYSVRSLKKYDVIRKLMERVLVLMCSDLKRLRKESVLNLKLLITTLGKLQTNKYLALEISSIII